MQTARRAARRFGAWLAAGAVLVPGLALAAGAAPPPLPMTLYGTVVTAAGAPVGAGTISAFVAGQAGGSVSFSSASGAFGAASYSAGAPSLAVASASAPAGAALSFTIGGVAASAAVVDCEGGSLAAGAAVTWSSGAICDVTLTVAAQPPSVAATGSSSAATSSAGTPATAGGSGSATPDTTATAAGGTGTVAVAEYPSDPEPSAGAGFSGAGAFFDVSVAPDSTFTSLAIQQCGAAAGDTLYWWDGGGWAAVTPQSLAGGCLSATLNDTSSSPTIAELGGTPVAVAVAGAAGGGTVLGGGGGTAAVPAVTAVTPDQGPPAGGIPVTITGSGFTDAEAVDFGTAAAAFTAVSDTEITAAEPAGSGSVDVTVATAAGTSQRVAGDIFTYTPAGAASVGPSGGMLATADGAFSMTLPAGALAAGAALTVAESPAPASGLPAGMEAASSVFTLTGTALAAAATATFAYSDSALGALSANLLSVYAQGPDGTWAFVPTEVDAADGTVLAAVTGPAALIVLVANEPFSDVPPAYWAASSIDAAAAAGIADGFPGGTFEPGATVTRAQFVKMLDTALGLPAGAPAQAFTDVAPADWFAPYVSAAVSAGIVQGLTATTFGPSGAVSRQQMGLLLSRALRLSGTQALTFSDSAQVAPWALAGVEASVAAGYLSGYPDGSLRPLAPATRADAAEVLARVVAHLAP